MTTPKIKTILFDLDGTFADTAVDLAAALNHTLKINGRDELPLEIIRPLVSHGGPALIQYGFNLEPTHPDFEPRRDELLQHYQDNIDKHTRLFPGLNEVLLQLHSMQINWGIVTNKPSWLTDPLMAKLKFDTTASCIISGDTLAERKPHPAPLLHACQLCQSTARQTLYIGDAQRDIQAGRRANMQTMVAMYGYLSDNDRPFSWAADTYIYNTGGILEWLVSNQKMDSID